MIPTKLLIEYSKACKNLNEKPDDLMVQEQFKIAELKIRLHHLIDKLKSKFSDELVLEISCINYKIECFKNRNNMTNKLIAKIDKESRIFKTAI